MKTEYLKGLPTRDLLYYHRKLGDPNSDLMLAIEGIILDRLAPEYQWENDGRGES